MDVFIQIKTYIGMLLLFLNDNRINNFYKNPIDDNVFQTKQELKEMIENYHNSNINSKDELTLFITLRKILPEEYENIRLNLEKSKSFQSVRPKALGGWRLGKLY